MPSYRTLILRQEEREQKKMDKQSARIHKALMGQLKPSDKQIIERLKVNTYGII